MTVCSNLSGRIASYGARTRSCARRPWIQIVKATLLVRLQDLVSPAQFPVLFLEVLDPLGISGGGTGTVAGIDLVLVDPRPQRFRVDPELVTNTAEDAPAGTGVGFEGIEDHADRSLTKLERVLFFGA